MIGARAPDRVCVAERGGVPLERGAHRGEPDERAQHTGEGHPRPAGPGGPYGVGRHGESSGREDPAEPDCRANAGRRGSRAGRRACGEHPATARTAVRFANTASAG